MLNILLEEIQIDTKGEGDMVDITDSLNNILRKSGLDSGLLAIFVSGSTAAVTTIEYEPGLKKDFPAALKRLVPNDIPYDHDKTWHDGNGHSHVRASLIGPSLNIPFRNCRLTLGTWQQVVIVEMDIHKRSRRLIIQVIGK